MGFIRPILAHPGTKTAQACAGAGRVLHAAGEPGMRARAGVQGSKEVPAVRRGMASCGRAVVEMHPLPQPKGPSTQMGNTWAFQ